MEKSLCGCSWVSVILAIARHASQPTHLYTGDPSQFCEYYSEAIRRDFGEARHATLETQIEVPARGRATLLEITWGALLLLWWHARIRLGWLKGKLGGVDGALAGHERTHGLFEAASTEHQNSLHL